MAYNYGQSSYGYGGYQPPIMSCPDDNEYNIKNDGFYDGPCQPCVQISLGGFFDWHGNTNWPSDYGGWHPGFINVISAPCKPVIPDCGFIDDGRSQLNFGGCEEWEPSYYDNPRGFAGPMELPGCGCYLDCEPRVPPPCETDRTEVSQFLGDYGGCDIPQYDPCYDPCAYDVT